MLIDLIIESHRISIREIKRVIPEFGISEKESLFRHQEWINQSKNLRDLCKRVCICICYENRDHLPDLTDFHAVIERVIMLNDAKLADSLSQIEFFGISMDEFCKQQGIKTIVAKQNLAKAKANIKRDCVELIADGSETRWERIQSFIEKGRGTLNRKELEIVGVACAAWSRELAYQKQLFVSARSIKSGHRKLVIEEPKREPEPAKKSNFVADSKSEYKKPKIYDIFDKDSEFQFRLSIFDKRLSLIFGRGRKVVIFDAQGKHLGTIHQNNQILEINQSKMPSELIFRELG